MNRKELQNIACVGGCTLDVYNGGETILPGGGGLNTAVHFRRLLPQAEISIIGNIGTDSESAILADLLTQNRINVSHLHHVPGQTSRQPIQTDTTGEKVFGEYEQGVIGATPPTVEDFQYLRNQDLIHGVIFTKIEPYLQAILLNGIDNGIVSVDFMSLKRYDFQADIVRKYLDSIDIGFFGLDVSQSILIDELQQIASEANKLFVVTLGKNGSLAFHGNKTYQQEALPVSQVIDTTGAGDSFAAAFLVQYAQTKDVASSLHAGSQLAAQTIQKRGAL